MQRLAKPVPAGSIPARETAELRLRTTVIADIDTQMSDLASRHASLVRMRTIVAHEREMFINAALRALGVDPSNQYDVDAETGEVVLVGVPDPEPVTITTSERVPDDG